jgi:hypothetical protein
MQLFALEHCWSISTGICWTTLLTTLILLSDYHLFTHTSLKNWLGSQCFNNNEELMDGVKTRLNSQAADFFDTSIRTLIP